MKKLQTLTTSSAIALASVGAPAFAQEAQATPVPADTAVNEPALVAKSQVKPLEKSEVPAPSTVKPALDAQKAVVKEAEVKINEAKFDVKAKEATVASTETEVAEATQAVKNAEATASQATPEKVAEVKDAQAKNLEAQTANQKATEATNEQIKSETKVLAEKQSDVATAQANLDQATKDVKTAEQAVASAQSSLDGTGLASAQKDLTQAQADVKEATKSVADAKTAKENASKADANRNTKVKDAQNEVKVKSDAVERKKAVLTNAQDKVVKADIALTQATEAMRRAEQSPNALVGENKTAIFSLNLFPEENTGIDLTFIPKTYVPSSHDKAVFEANVKRTKDLMIESQNYFGDSRINIKDMRIKPYTVADTQKWVDVRNMSFEDLKDINELAIRTLNDLREQKAAYDNSKFTPSQLSKGVIENAYNVAKAYMAKGYIDGHDDNILNKYNISSENIFGTGTSLDEMSSSNLTNYEKRKDRYHRTMAELKSAVIREIVNSTTNDAHAGWGHARHNTTQYPYTAIAFTVTDENDLMMHTLSSFGIGVDTSDSDNYMVTNRQYLDYLKSLTSKTDIYKLKAELAQATTAFENAKRALTQASTDYANALSLKTDAEKVLADTMATPLQAQVAENNLRLANIALENAKKREATASEAVTNFSASLADKKTALEEAQNALKEAKLVQTSASQALLDAKASLEAQEAKINSLKAQSEQLIAEKDTLVKEAQQLADTLQAYLDAPVALTKAKQARTAVSVKLELAKADLEMAQSKLENLLTAQKAEEAKLAELEAEYAKLVDLAEKAQENVVATLPDGTVIAVPKVAPTAETLPELNLDAIVKEDAKDSVVKQLPDGTIVAVPKNAPVAETLPELNLEELAKEDAKDSVVKTLPDGTIVAVPKDAPVAEELPTVNVDELKKALDAGKEVTLDAQGNVVVRDTKPATDEKPVNVDRPQDNNDKSNKAYANAKNVTIDDKGNVIVKGQTYTSQQQASSKPTYSRVERAKTLPNTGTKESNLTLFILAILSGLGIALKRREGK